MCDAVIFETELDPARFQFALRLLEIFPIRAQREMQHPLRLIIA